MCGRMESEPTSEPNHSTSSSSIEAVTESNRRFSLVNPAPELMPAWREFIRFCADLGHGEIERLIIQDGVPVLAEITKKKIKFPARSERSAL